MRDIVRVSGSCTLLAFLLICDLTLSAKISNTLGTALGGSTTDVGLLEDDLGTLQLAFSCAGGASQAHDDHSTALSTASPTSTVLGTTAYSKISPVEKYLLH